MYCLQSSQMQRMRIHLHCTLIPFPYLIAVATNIASERQSQTNTTNKEASKLYFTAPVHLFHKKLHTLLFSKTKI